MRVINCLCGSKVEGADTEALVAEYVAHNEQRHADIKISDEVRADLIEAIRRSGGWDGETEVIEDTVEVRPLTPALRDQYLGYFDGPGLCDNPVWARCYCLSYHLALPPEEQFDARRAALNRTERAAQIDRGEASGVLAFAGDRVVGWCNASPRTSLPLLDRTPGFECENPQETAAIVCLVVAPRYRGQGIAHRLLDGAVTLARDGGFKWLDAYPPKKAPTAAASYHGRLDMYLKGGFEQVRDTGRYVVVRKAL